MDLINEFLDKQIVSNNSFNLNVLLEIVPELKILQEMELGQSAMFRKALWSFQAWMWFELILYVDFF
jgi:hypothetical protein